jgi:acetylornithine/N-succinyldiaminopimelate aminotransferase
VESCRRRGLLVLSAGVDVVRLAPPLNIDAADVAEALEIIGDALSEAGSELHLS